MQAWLIAMMTALWMLACVLNGCGGAEERKAEHLERGKKYFAEHNYDKAKVEFKNVLQIDPKTAQPYFYLGQIEEDKQNWREAFALYQKAVELDASDVDAKTKLAKFYLLVQEREKASELVAAILQVRPGDIEARLLKAGIANLQGTPMSCWHWCICKKTISKPHCVFCSRESKKMREMPHSYWPSRS